MPLSSARASAGFLPSTPLLIPSPSPTSRAHPPRPAPLHPSTPFALPFSLSPAATAAANAAAVAAAAAALLLLPLPPAATPALAAVATPPTRFGANTVSAPDLLVLPTPAGPPLALSRPRLLGAGGSGAVFAYDRAAAAPVAVKFSWPRTAPSVRAECAALRALELARVGGVTRCLAEADYDDLGGGVAGGGRGGGGGEARAVIATEPVVEDVVADVRAVRDVEGRERAVRRVVRTMVEMLAAGVVTSDVQPLVSGATGEVVFIDLTEAERVRSGCGGGGGACTAMDGLELARVAAFVGEMLSLVPEELEGVAAAALEEELVGAGGSGARLATKVYTVLAGQGSVVSPATAAFIEHRVGV